MTLMSNIIRRMGGTWTACDVLQASKERRNWTDIIANIEQHGTYIEYRMCVKRILPFFRAVVQLCSTNRPFTKS